MKANTFFCLCLFFIFSVQYLFAQKEYQLDSTTIEVSPLVKNLVAPWEIIWGPDNYIWVTHNKGVISRVNPNTGETKDILTITDIYRNPNSLNDSRMVGLTIGSNFQEAPFVYINYVYKGEVYTSRNWFKYMKVVKYRYDSTSDQLIEPQTLLDDIKVYDGWHVGGKLLISPDNQYLFLTIGDAKQVESPSIHPDWTSDTSKPLSLQSYSGKILRIGVDGSVPQDNPFVTSADKTPQNLIWSYGHRNTQGLVFGTNEHLYYAEHGPANDDEAGIIQKGGDFGWPEVEGFCDRPNEKDYCDASNNFLEPIKAWPVPIAPSNMEFYNSTAIPEWQNSLLIASLTGTNREGEDIRVLKLDKEGTKVIGESILFDKEYLRIRDLCVAPNGDVFFTSSNLVLNKGRTLGEDDIIWKISAKKAPLLNGKNITSFSIPEQEGETIIDTLKHTVFLEVNATASITALTPTISISEGASISPKSGIVQDFSNPVTYIVTAEDGTTQEWEVTVNIITGGIEDISESNFFFVPNPVNNNLLIEESIEIEQIKFFTVEGKLVKSIYPISSNIVDLSTLGQGIYIAVFVDKNKNRKAFRIIKE